MDRAPHAPRGHQFGVSTSAHAEGAAGKREVARYYVDAAEGSHASVLTNWTVYKNTRDKRRGSYETRGDAIVAAKMLAHADCADGHTAVVHVRQPTGSFTALCVYAAEGATWH